MTDANEFAVTSGTTVASAGATLTEADLMRLGRIVHDVVTGDGHVAIIDHAVKVAQCDAYSATEHERKLSRRISEWAQEVSAALGGKPGEFNLTPDQANRQIRELNAKLAEAKASPSLPDVKSPEALRFAADVAETFDRLRSGDRAISSIFRERADLLEAAKTAQDHTIEQAARAMYEARRPDSCDWESGIEKTKELYRVHARALAEAGLLNTVGGEA